MIRMPPAENILSKVIALCSRHGYVYKSLANRNLEGVGLYDFGPLGVGLKQNMEKEWWYSMVTCQENIHGIESPLAEQMMQSKMTHSEDVPSQSAPKHIQGDSKEDNTKYISRGLRTSLYQGTLLHYSRTRDLVSKHLPFGTAQTGICFRQGIEQHMEKFIYSSLQNTQLSVQFYCSPKSATQWLDSWQRIRLEWWRKLAENPSNFIAADLQTRGDVQMLDIQYKFPWGADTIETIYNHGKGPIEDLQKWMEIGPVESGGNLMASNSLQDSSNNVLEQKYATDLRARDGRKNVLPYTLEMTADLERGMMAYLLDGYCEKIQTKSARKRSSHVEIMNLHARLAPFKVAITMRSSSADHRQLNMICQYLKGEFMKANINVLVDSSTQSLTEKSNRFDAMGVLFLIVLHEPTIKEGTVVIRSRGLNIPHGKHISQVKEFVQQHLDYV